MNRSVVAALVVGVVVWFAGWAVALQFVEGLQECLEEVVGAFLAVTAAAVGIGALAGAFAANRRW